MFTDIPLPNVLNPVFDYLQDNLPPPLYNFIFVLLSNSLALFAAFFTLASSLFPQNPEQWTTQTLLLPLAAFLSAYLALLSLYRTTTWVLRTSIWIVKWGTIIGALSAFAGWSLGQGGNDIGNAGPPAAFGGVGNVLMSLFNEAKAQPKGNKRSQNRPKPWQSFQAHEEWQQEQDKLVGDIDVDKIINDALSSVEQSSWWKIAQSIAGTGRTSDSEDEKGKRQTGKTKGSKSR